MTRHIFEFHSLQGKLFRKFIFTSFGITSLLFWPVGALALNCPEPPAQNVIEDKLGANIDIELIRSSWALNFDWGEKASLITYQAHPAQK